MYLKIYTHNIVCHLEWQNFALKRPFARERGRKNMMWDFLHQQNNKEVLFLSNIVSSVFCWGIYVINVESIRYVDQQIQESKIKFANSREAGSMHFTWCGCNQNEASSSFANEEV